MKLRDNQKKAHDQIIRILNDNNICYLAGETRSGKTLTVLQVCQSMGFQKVLLITKKKAISSIRKDFDFGKFTYKLILINYASSHKIIDNDFDLVIYDESHALGAYPKPSKRTKNIRKKFYNIPCILMSGTPATESYSQFYHQFYVSRFSPFREYSNFYKWANDYVNKKQRNIGSHIINDYSYAVVSLIDQEINPLMVIMKKPDEGFSEINETELYVEVPDKITSLVKRIIKDRAIEGNTGYILCDTPAKLQSKVHQITNGSVIININENETKSVILSDYKAKYIQQYFEGKKIAIMYYYQAELQILKEVFGENITTDLDEFNSSSKNIAIQQKTTEGQNISAADCLVYYNFGFSGKDYIQSRDRLTIKGRETNEVFFILEKGKGINRQILKTVRDKKDYNSLSFKKDFL